MKFIVKMYDINGEHFLLNNENKLMLFDSINNAKKYLKSFSLSDDEIDELKIVFPSDEELKDNYITEVK